MRSISLDPMTDGLRLFVLTSAAFAGAALLAYGLVLLVGTYTNRLPPIGLRLNLGALGLAVLIWVATHR